MVQCPVLGSLTSKAQTWQPAGAPRPCQPPGIDNCGKNVTGVLDFSLLGNLSKPGSLFQKYSKPKCWDIWGLQWREGSKLWKSTLQRPSFPHAASPLLLLFFFFTKFENFSAIMSSNSLSALLIPVFLSHWWYDCFQIRWILVFYPRVYLFYFCHLHSTTELINGGFFKFLLLYFSVL